MSSFTSTPSASSAFITSTPSASDSFDKTFKSVSNMMIIIPMIFGFILLIVVVVVVSCYCRSQRVKRDNAAQAERALQQRQDDELRIDRQLTPALQHVVLVSPTALTYNSTIGDEVSVARALPSAPSVDHAYEIALQQRELDRYKRTPVRPSPSPSPSPPPPIQQYYSVPPSSQPPPPPPQQSQPWDDPIFITSRIPMDALYSHSLISRGGFGEVYKGTYRSETVAMKKLLPGTQRDLKQIAGFFAEIKLMATMEHERIVRYIGVAWDALSDVCVVTEFMEGGDLRTALTHFAASDPPRPQGLDKQKATLALHVAHALTYMHSLAPVVLHRDLKSKNILLDKTYSSAKLTDFGISRERSDETMTAAVGTILWMAPEVMAGDRYDQKADIFSFGIVLSELDTHALPYADVKARMVNDSGRPLPDTALLQRIMSGRVTVSFSANLREDVLALCKSCVAVNPSQRPTAAQLLYELHKIMNSL